MEQHPIPQDVTGFQFKLIGSMTVKQFAYVAAGVITAVIIYYLPLNFPLSVLVKLILIPMIGGSGFVVAFLPIDGRPIDVMSVNLAKALFSPNQYIYHKEEKHFSFTTIATTPQITTTTTTQAHITPDSAEVTKQKQLQSLLLQNTQGRIRNDMDKKESLFLQNFSTPQQAAPIAQTKQITQTIKKQPDKEKPTSETLEKKEAVLLQELTTAKQEEAKQQIPAAHDASHQKVTLLEQQIQQIHLQKQQVENELAQLKQQLATSQNKTTPPPPLPAQQLAMTQPTPLPTAQAISPTIVPQKPLIKKAGIPTASDTPNVVIGAVKDPRGNVLPNMLVEVKDKDGNPVRAFKTNPLGQFASATPLAAGTYTIEVEDPKKAHSFDIMQIIANNQIMAPLEIISHDAREALRKELFN